jgi:predicted RNA binding protein YcfA (HicA-like mRNA interferase family)
VDLFYGNAVAPGTPGKVLDTTYNTYYNHTVKFREIEKIVTDDGWFLARVKGSHYHYHHLSKKGTVTIPKHPGDIPQMVVHSILQQAEIK